MSEITEMTKEQLWDAAFEAFLGFTQYDHDGNPPQPGEAMAYSMYMMYLSKTGEFEKELSRRGELDDFRVYADKRFNEWRAAKIAEKEKENSQIIKLKTAIDCVRAVRNMVHLDSLSAVTDQQKLPYNYAMAQLDRAIAGIQRCYDNGWD